MFGVAKKLKLLKHTIREFSKQNYSGIEKRTAQAHEKLLQAQAAMLSSPTPINASFELRAAQEWDELSTAESAFFFRDLA